MKQKILTITLIVIIVGLLAVVVQGSKTNKAGESTIGNVPEIKTTVTLAPAPQTPVLFYGNTCPHCTDLETWIEENQIDQKIQINRKEVYDNRANAQELSRAAKSCNMNTSSIGVPFMYTPEGNCLVGTPGIQSYLRVKAELTPENSAPETNEQLDI